MATPSKETVVKFKADTKDYEERVKALNQSNKMLRQELKLAQTEMKMSASDTDKLKTSLSSLEKQYEIAKQKTRETTEQLARAKQVWGENSAEAQKAEQVLNRAKIAEAELSNKIKQTTEDLKRAKEAEAARNSESTKSKQTLDELKQKESQLEVESKKLKAAYDLERTALGQKASETQKAKLQYDYMRQAQEQAVQTTQNLQQQLNAAKGAFGENSKQVKELETRLLEAKRAEQELARQTEELGRRVGTGFREAASHVTEFGNRVQESGRKIKEMGTSASMHVTAPIVAGFGAAVHAASEFSHEMADVRKEVNATGLSSKEVDAVMRQMGDSSLKWSQQFGVSTADINEGLLVLVKDGYSASEAMQIMNTSLYTAQGANEKLSTVVDQLGSSLEAYGLKTDNAAKTTENAAHMADTFAYISNHTKASVSSLGESFSIAGSTMAALKQPMEVTAAAIGTLQSNGVEASVAANALKSGVVNLVSPTKEMSKSLQSMNVEVFDSQGVMKPLPQLLNEMEHGMKGWTDEQRNAAIATIFGKESLSSWNILLHKGGDSLGKLATDAKNANGEVKHLSEQMQNTPENQFKRLQQTLHSIAVVFGQEILPALMPVVQEVQKFVEWIAHLDKDTKQTIVTIAAIAAAIGPLLIVIGSVISAVGKIIVGIGSFIRIMGTVISIISTVAEVIGIVITVISALVGAPVAAVVAAIAGIIAAVVGAIAIFKNWGGVTDWLSEKWSQFSSWFGELWGNLVQACSDGWSSTVEYFSNAWSSFLEMCHSFFDPIGQFFSDLWSGIVETASSWWSNLVETAVSFFSMLTQAWQETWDFILRILDPAISLISTLLEAGWLLIQAGTQIAWALICKYIIDPIVEASNWCKEKIGDLVNWLNEKWEFAKSITLAAWNLFKQYIVQPVQEAWSWVVGKLGDLANWILGKWEYLKSITLSAWNSVKQHIIDPIVSAYNSVVEKFSSMYNAAVEKFNSIKNAASEKFNAAKDAIVNPIKDAVDKVKEWIDKIKGFFNDLKLKIPKPEMPKLPHFSLETSTKTVAGKEITYPTGIHTEWRAKGGIFTRPTIFGMSNGKLQGAGEAGPEAVLPLNEKTLGAIGRGIVAAMSNDGILSNLQNITANTMGRIAGQQQQIQQVNETGDVKVNFYTTVRNDRDIDNMFEKADDWFAKRGQSLNIGVGRVQRV